MKMKKIYKIIGFLALINVATFSSCENKLIEKPFTVFTPEYFKTPSGFQSGIVALYSGLRFLYGPEGAVTLGVVGTDEWTYADQPRTGAGGTQDIVTMGNYTLDLGNGQILTPWNRSYFNINLANGLVEFAAQVPISESEKNIGLAEIRFLRALYYLNLVQHFGAVPLDLGSGELKFNQVAFQDMNRLPLVEVLTKNYQAIIDDLTFATKNLPDRRPANAFRLSKAAAFALLAKAYIHRAYSSAKQATDFENAFTAATEVINNQARYGTTLLPNFADVHRPKNDYNLEIIFSVERIPGNNNANEVGNPTGIGGGKGVDAANDFNPDYTAVRAPLVNSATQPCATRNLLYGRPIRRFCPTPWLYNVAFADKENDSRFDGSFRMVWLATQDGGGFRANIDTGFVLAKTNRIADSLNALTAPGGGRLKPYRVIAPREFYLIGGSFAQNIYPGLSKYEDPDKLTPNDTGGRPFPVIKLSEVYLLAAEAAVQLGRTNEAANFVNVLKRRAAFRPGLTNAQVEARYNAIRVSPAQMNLDYILDERTRELCGESNRWPDLAIRGKLLERVKAYNPDGAANIKDFHVVRPIPRSQLDALTVPNASIYQNPGY
ncbi:MAG: RagB/SusD family nutrient uptake outer membrane protein [Thermoflexibacter sp.]